jgi:hypothetical protein
MDKAIEKIAADWARKIGKGNWDFEKEQRSIIAVNLTRGENKVKNKFEDLHNHLFEQLERLNDDELVGDKLTDEIRRANAMTQVASQIIAGGNLVLNAAKAVDNAQGKIKLPLLLSDD